MNNHPGSLLVLAYDQVGTRMAGPAIRSWELAHATAETGVRVTFATETPVDRPSESPNLTVTQYASESHLRKLADEHEAILIQGLALHRNPQLANTSAIVIVDLYDPWVLENLELHAGKVDAQKLLLNDAAIQRELLNRGDFFICASERQRDYWLGMLTAQGRLIPDVHSDDAELRGLIDVVPYGCPALPPTADTVSGLRGSLGIDADAPVLLWSGGTWEWFDPLTVLDALEIARSAVPNLTLVFLGMTLSGQPDMPVARQIAARLAESETLRDAVRIGDWIPYDLRGSWLVDADLAVIATRPGIEPRMAFRSRVLDHLWAGLPTISTPGDVLTEELTANGAGWTVPFDSPRELADLIVTLAADPKRLAAASDASQLLAKNYSWGRAIGPLAEVAANPDRWRNLRDRRPSQVFEAPPKSDRILGGRRARPQGFHSRGPLIDMVKLSPLYPLMQKARRTTFGQQVWGTIDDTNGGSKANDSSPPASSSQSNAVIRPPAKNRAISPIVRPANKPTPTGGQVPVTVILVAMTTRHLENILGSLSALEYPSELVDVIVIDNGSGGDVSTFVQDKFPWARAIVSDHNMGFAPAVNLGATHAVGDVIALVNDDMRVDPQWLSAMVNELNADTGAVCVGGKILDWNGAQVDFHDSAIHWTGHGLQLGYGSNALHGTSAVDGDDIPFACGGSMLVDRKVFLTMGGFDESYFAYFEDVDFGWRLRIRGLRTVFSASSVAFHRHHGSSLSSSTRAFLMERNALRMLVTNTESKNVEKLLGAATMRAIAKIALKDECQNDTDGVAIDAMSAARLRALVDVTADLDSLLDRRGWVQSQRLRSDSEVFEHFKYPMLPADADSAASLSSVSSIERLFGISELFSKSSATHILVIEEQVGQLQNEVLSLTAAGAGRWQVMVAPQTISEAELALLLVGADLVVAPMAVWNRTQLLHTAPSLMAIVDDSGETPAYEPDFVIPRNEVVMHVAAAMSTPWKYYEMRGDKRPPALTPAIRDLLSLFMPGTRWWTEAPAELRTRIGETALHR